MEELIRDEVPPVEGSTEYIRGVRNRSEAPIAPPEPETNPAEDDEEESTDSLAGDPILAALAKCEPASENGPPSAALLPTGSMGRAPRGDRSGSARRRVRNQHVRAGDILFGTYRVIRPLGKGGMGQVWLVHNIKLERDSALKLINPEIAHDEKAWKRFKREAQFMAKIKHPNAVHVYVVERTPTQAYIEMEYVQGRSLDSVLKHRKDLPLSPKTTAAILKQLCAVLETAHAKGIVHRDLSPSNLMLEKTPEGRFRLRVLDFGIAKMSRPKDETSDGATLTEMGQFFGKSAYASPEQFRAAKDVDKLSDIYSIGVILYEILTGTRPFHGTNDVLALQHLQNEPPPFAQVNPGIKLAKLERVVRRCLEKDPAKRPQSALELKKEFLRALPETEGPSKLGPKPHSVVARAVILALALFVTALLGCLTILFVPVLAGMLTIDKKEHPDRPVKISPQVKEYLEGKGFQPIDASGLADNGWPRAIRRSSDDQAKFVLRKRVYLPEPYQPDAEKGTVGALPLVLVREDDVRFHLIQGSEFTMGAFNEKKGDFQDEELPGHRMILSSFYMQRTEVNFGEFESFCGKTQREHDKELDLYYQARNWLKTKTGDDGWRKYPAVGVPRKLAEEYAHYVGGELPSEAQWEYAARSGGKEQLYVGGNQRPTQANLNKILLEGELIGTCPVDCATNDCTEQRVIDLTGNVREWCRDVWDRYSMVSLPPDYVRVANSDDANPLYVIRGGSYDTPSWTARVTWRAYVPGEKSVVYKARNSHADSDLGFRVVVEHLVEVPEKLMAHTESKTGSSGMGLR